MAELITRTVPIGISACVFRCPVRYNGKSFDALATLGRERSDFAFTPVCPECMAGLGVPRMPIHLTGPGVRAMIVKESSPSCGVCKAKVGKKCAEQIEGSGVFGAMLLETGWFLIPDSALTYLEQELHHVPGIIEASRTTCCSERVRCSGATPDACAREAEKEE